MAVGILNALPEIDTVASDVASSLCSLIRHCIVESGSSSSTDSCSVGSALAEDVRRFIDRHLGHEALSLAWLAESFGCSKRTIQRRFEQRYDESLSGYIWRTRLERAAEALPGSTNMSELARDFGFCSSAHFSRAFKKRFGKTPSAFRRHKTTDPSSIS